MNRFFQIILLSFFMVLPFISEASWEQKKKQADEAFQSGKFSEAIKIYEESLSLIPEENNSPELHFNLGNAFYKSNQLGSAILHYEKALILSPKDNDIFKNLHIAKEEIKGDVIPIRPFVLVKWWNRLKTFLPSHIWAFIGIAILWLGIMGILIWMFSKNRQWKKKGFFTGLILIFLSIIPFLLSFGKMTMESYHNRAILMEKETPLRNSPDGTGDFVIYEGTELEILDQIGEWAKVRLLNSDVGWVKKKEMEKI